MVTEAACTGAEVIASLACTGPVDVDLVFVEMGLATEAGVAAALAAALAARSPQRIAYLTAPKGMGAAAAFAAVQQRPVLAKPIRWERFVEVATELLEAPPHPLRVPLPARAAGSLRVDHGGVHILLAEDNPVNQKLATILLRKRGYQVTVVDNGQRALEAIAGSCFDLVLMDVQMPEMSGTDATRELRRREERTLVHLPVIAMTAHAMKGDAEKFLDAGMDDYVSKPVEPELLYACIDRVLTRQGNGGSAPRT